MRRGGVGALPDGWRGSAGRGSRRRLLTSPLAAVVVLAALAVSGCGGGRVDVEPPPSGPAAGLAAYLADPLLGFELGVGADDALRLERAHRALLETGDRELAASTARQLLTRDPELPPAHVLAAQVRFLEGDHQAVVDRLAPLREQFPGYQAAAVLSGRSLDLLGHELEAYAAYRDAPEVPAALRRAEDLATSVEADVDLRLEELLAEQRLDLAEEFAARVGDLFPGEPVAWRTEAAVAEVVGEPERELTARRELSLLVEPSPEQRVRLAELEVEVGDPTQGVEMFEQLVALHPDDYDLRERLEAAKFSWRLQMLPPQVSELARSEQLSRSDFATLLFWIVPGVRATAPERATIVDDVPLDHPHRREVLRVVNLDLMGLVDPTVRRFAPSAPLSRGQALDLLLRLPTRLGAPTSCAADYARSPGGPGPATCATAARCALIASEESCHPSAGLDGVESREMIRRLLNLL